MLFKYKNDYEKIAMGFLSFIPDLKEVSHVQAELALYASDEQRNLYLWRNEAGDFAGIVGIELGTDYILVRHISLNPSERSAENYFVVLDELAALYPENRVMGSLETAPLIAKWEHQQNKETD
ncbi:hypothetical protein [Latilactobacillus graminis]|uniref:RibT protein n=2 Tax=Latilactobacillus graminis TaxID=60519 RepID=A0AA89L512_9LACO|nr:hypothetical protein [Latilactobacillus graminis]KRM23795.1 ribT protein [Latilactobacillus graminis DSM 20719]QFP79686.1 N-acetyltransferase [Latilactobacillus graminis]